MNSIFEFQRALCGVDQVLVSNDLNTRKVRVVGPQCLIDNTLVDPVEVCGVSDYYAGKDSTHIVVVPKFVSECGAEYRALFVQSA